MENLLYLVHRIPYPPNKGDKIRSFHLLKYLATHFKIYLGAFIDDEQDWKYASELEPYCEEINLIGKNATRSKLKSIQGFFNSQALTIPYYSSNKMRAWVRSTIKNNQIDTVLMFSSSMAQYMLSEKYKNLLRVIDFVDVDSDKWKQYSNHCHWPMSWIYSREARLLQRYEIYIASQFDASLFVSQHEAQHFSNLIPALHEKIGFFNNGVDVDYFSPDLEYRNPYEVKSSVIVFTGAMDYWANINAVTWFVDTVLPKIQEKMDVQFYIVGSNPTEEVIKLSNNNGVIVTGRVDDVRPYLYYSSVVVAPLLIARGIQNKVLEAMAMSCTTVCTSAAAEGIGAESGKHYFVEDDPTSMSEVILKAINETSNLLGDPRKYVMDHYQWSTSLNKVRELLTNNPLKQTSNSIESECRVL